MLSVSTLAFQARWLSPLTGMILTGAGLYMAYGVIGRYGESGGDQTSLEKLTFPLQAMHRRGHRLEDVLLS